MQLRAQPASDETLRGFRVYIACRAAQIVDMAQDWVNISSATQRCQEFSAQFAARHARVVFWEEHKLERFFFPDLVIEPSDEQFEALVTDPDFARDVAHHAFLDAANRAHYARRTEFGWMPNGWLGAWTENVALPLAAELRPTDLLVSHESTRSRA